MEINSIVYFVGFFLVLIIIDTSPLRTSAAKDTPCSNYSAGRFKRDARKPGGVTVCITANEGNVNVHGISSNKQKHHQNDEENSGSSSVEDTDGNRGPSDDDNSETEEDDMNYPHQNGGSGSNNPSPHSGSRFPSKGNKKKKGKENMRIIVEEKFTLRNWSSEWTHARNPNGSTIKLYNKFSRVYARKSNHSRPNYGIITNNKGGEFYMIATTFPPFNNRNETLILQFSVQFQSKAHCQLVFLRLYDCQFDINEFGVQTPYIMQVGPYICATSRINRLTAEFQDPGKTTIKSVDKNVEPINNTSVNTYTLVLEPDGTYHMIINTNSTQNGTLKDQFQNYKGYTSICSVGLVVWHSVLDKYFKGQIIVDDLLVVNDLEYAEKQRIQILNLYSSESE